MPNPPISTNRLMTLAEPIYGVATTGSSHAPSQGVVINAATPDEVMSMALELLATRKKLTQPKIPEILSHWCHHNGNLYKVIGIANRDTDRQDKYPITIVYQGTNGRVWSRPLSRWYASMTELAEGLYS